MKKTRNWLLLAGISLPVVLLLVFVGLAEIARRVVEPPKYALYFSSYSYATTERKSVQLTYSVVKDRIQVFARPNEYATPHQLFRLDPRNGEVEEIIFAVPDVAAKEGEVISVAKLAEITVSPDRESPDGFQLVDSYQRGPGLIGELFSSRRKSGITLEKTGAAFHFDKPTNTSYGSVQFLGWIVAERDDTYE